MLLRGHLTQKSYQLVHYGLMLVAASLCGVFLFSSSAYAAYPAEYCDFSQTADKKYVNASCKDDTANGSFDDERFSLISGGDGTSIYELKQTYEYTPAYPPGQATQTKECVATITITDTTANIKGQYKYIETVYEAYTTKEVYSCRDLEEGKIPLSRGDGQALAWSNAFHDALKKSLIASVCKKKGDACKAAMRNAVEACKSDLVISFNSSGLSREEYKVKYADAMKDCLKTKLSVPAPFAASNAQINNAVNEASGKGNDAENGPGLGNIDDESTPTEDETSCAVDGIGWIICPIMTFMAKMNDAAFGFLNNFLGIRPALITDEATRSAWAAFRDIANVAFVIAFMVIVYSQITSAGVSNYGIKRLLPKLFIAAILVNVSYWLCAAMVDVSNIVGSSAYSLLKDSIDVGTGGTVTSGWTGAVENVLAIAAAGIGLVLLALVVILAPTSLLAFAVILLILIARQAFVILLLAIAPLAFVAYLLPNTEDWFKKWWKAFTVTLMVYPIVGIVFGASSMASQILMNVADDGGAGGDDEQLLKIIALGVLAVPLFAVPALLKGSLAAAGSIGARLSGLGDRTGKLAAGKGRERLKESAAGQFLAYRGQENQRKRALARSGKATGSNKNPLNWRRNATAAVMGRANSSTLSGKFGDRLAAGGADLENKMWDEEVKRQSTLVTVGKNMTNEQILDELDKGKGSAEYQAALGSVIMQRNHRESHLKALEIVRRRQEAASASGDTGEGGVVAGIQKQMLHDGASNMPWAMGDQAMGAMENGQYGAAGQAGSGVSLREQLQGRVGTHMSVANLAKMNPDELKSIHKMAKNGDLAPDQLAAVRDAITKLRLDENYKGSEKQNATVLYEEILGTTPYSVDAAGNSTNYDEARVF